MPLSLRMPATTLLTLLVGCGDGLGPLPGFEDDEPGAAILVGSGDIALCNGRWDEATAELLDGIPGIVFTTGDNVYPDGTEHDFETCYAPSWGRHRSRTRPSAGNHEYEVAGAAGYFKYFGDRAGPAGAGYYSYDHGSWHIIVLNSNLSLGAGSAQLRWLKEDLNASTARCTLGYWHHPHFTSSPGPEWDNRIETALRVLHEAGAEVILSGHAHNYERFAPQTPWRTADDEGGIRQFVIGTGGAELHGFGPPAPHSEIRGRAYGVLRLALRENGYSWRFVSVAGEHFTDSGSDECH